MTKNNTFCGSPGYLAPECSQGPQAPGLNWAMDIYAVGVIAYELYFLLFRLSNSQSDRQTPFRD
jgi:serine/threonine protein kinase